MKINAAIIGMGIGQKHFEAIEGYRNSKVTIICEKDKKKIWIHAASVGELVSVIPILKKLEENKNIKNIIITTSTTSSARIFKKLKFQKTIHVYFPLDTNLITKKFIKYWQPELAIFIESEIWPNMIKNLYLKKMIVGKN